MSQWNEDPEISAADDRTLRLATPQVTPELLDQFVAYQRALIAVGPDAFTGAASYALAHQSALRDAGLPIAQAAPLEALVRSFAGKRAAAKALRNKRGELKLRLEAKRARGERLTKREEEADAKLAEQAAAVGALPALERRYGAAAIRALAQREDELVALHVELEALRRGAT